MHWLLIAQASPINKLLLSKNLSQSLMVIAGFREVELCIYMQYHACLHALGDQCTCMGCTFKSEAEVWPPRVYMHVVHSRLLHGPYFNLTDFRLWLTTLPSEAHRHKPVQLLAVCIQCRFNLLHLMDVFGDLRYGQPACKTVRPLGGAALYTLSRVLQLNVRCCLFCRSSGKGYLAWTLVGRIAILSTLVSFRIPPLFKLAAPDN